MIQTILCPVDFSPVSERELRLASQLCRRFGSKLVVQHCLSAVPPVGLGVSWMHAGEHLAEDKARVDETRERIRALLSRIPAGVKTEAKFTYGSVDRTLLDLAAMLPADLIVIGTHGRSSVEHRSATERVIFDAPCPVLTTRDHSPDVAFPELDAGGLATIETLVPVDFSAHSQRALEYAYALSAELPLKLNVLHVDPAGGEDQGRSLDRLQTAVPADLRDRVVIETRRGRAVDEILRHESKLSIRLILMGTHHKAAIKRLFSGSTAREVLHFGSCPVWFVPEAGNH
jgi:nucleotide-binding universal stress UspA family protein